MGSDDRYKRIRKAAHDVSTPLTSIAGFAELIMEDEGVTASVRENAGIILNEAKRISAILDEFFDDMSQPNPLSDQ